MNDVKFKIGTLQQYEALQNKDQDTIYFIVDKHLIYKGSLLMGSGNIEGLLQNDNIELYGGSATEVIE